jgi:hypothetical protein
MFIILFIIMLKLLLRLAPLPSLLLLLPQIPIGPSVSH